MRSSDRFTLSFILIFAFFGDLPQILILQLIVHLTHLLIDALLESEELVLVAVETRQSRVVAIHVRQQLAGCCRRGPRRTLFGHRRRRRHLNVAPVRLEQLAGARHGTQQALRHSLVVHRQAFTDMLKRS